MVGRIHEGRARQFERSILLRAAMALLVWFVDIPTAI